MRSLIRAFAVALRRREAHRSERLLQQQFLAWKDEIGDLPACAPEADSVALVRLDDIGDYLLWRNMLPAYRARYAGRRLVLIGNQIWEPVFRSLDASCADLFIGLDKSRYHRDASYRRDFWLDIRKLGVAELVCVSRTRPLLLDDCIAMAAAAPLRIAAENNLASEVLNTLSDKQYHRLIPRQELLHEFAYNRYFAGILCQNVPLPEQLRIDLPEHSPSGKIVCFIGASARSKRWPVAYWIGLLQLLIAKGFEVILSGGPSEQEMAAAIAAEIVVDNRVGRMSLLQTLTLIAGARALITGDTMAAHAGAGAAVPTVIIANGINATHFVAYSEAGYTGVSTLYTQAYLRYSGRKNFIAVSSDMESIKPEQVMSALMALLGHPVTHS